MSPVHGTRRHELERHVNSNFGDGGDGHYANAASRSEESLFIQEVLCSGNAALLRDFRSGDAFEPKHVFEDTLDDTGVCDKDSEQPRVLRDHGLYGGDVRDQELNDRNRPVEQRELPSASSLALFPEASDCAAIESHFWNNAV